MGGRPWHPADPREARASAPRNSSLSSDHRLPSRPKGPLPPKARGLTFRRQDGLALPSSGLWAPTLKVYSVACVARPSLNHSDTLRHKTACSSFVPYFPLAFWGQTDKSRANLPLLSNFLPQRPH